jgi:hypothetical protein
MQGEYAPKQYVVVELEELDQLRPLATRPWLVLHLIDALKQSIEQARNGSAEQASEGRKPGRRRATG